MKYLIKFFFAVILVAALVFAVKFFLFPFVYSLKEPYFEIPIETRGKIEHVEELPIRSDSYGDGVFGAKRKGGRRHTGLDLAANLGSPVYASKSGWARVRVFPGGYGSLVIISHPGNYETRYGHLMKVYIKRFQWVGQGRVIGSVGKTGNANAKGILPHLHFEIRYKDKPLDPAVFLVKNGG